MSYTLSLGEISQIQTYKNNGQYKEAYYYVAGVINNAVSLGQVSQGTQNWFTYAAEINSNEPTVVNEWGSGRSLK